jgi:hypothetical protein
MENQKKRILLSAKDKLWVVNCYQEIKEIMSHSSKKCICEKVVRVFKVNYIKSDFDII